MGKELLQTFLEEMVRYIIIYNAIGVTVLDITQISAQRPARIIMVKTRTTQMKNMSTKTGMVNTLYRQGSSVNKVHRNCLSQHGFYYIYNQNIEHK